MLFTACYRYTLQFLSTVVLGSYEIPAEPLKDPDMYSDECPSCTYTRDMTISLNNDTILISVTCLLYSSFATSIMSRMVYIDIVYHMLLL